MVVLVNHGASELTSARRAVDTGGQGSILTRLDGLGGVCVVRSVRAFFGYMPARVAISLAHVAWITGGTATRGHVPWSNATEGAEV